MLRMRPLALFGAGLLLGATVGFVRAAIPSDTGLFSACYDNKDGTLHVIDSTVTTCSKTQKGPVTWNQVGPQGPAGSPGPQGSPGLLGDLDSLDGLPCTGPNGSGQVMLVKKATGLQETACATGGTGFSVDSWNNTQDSAEAVTLSCGQSITRSGTTMPAGTSDWFKITYTLGACTGLHIAFTSNPNTYARFHVYDFNKNSLNGDPDAYNGYGLDWTLTSPSPVWVEVWTPYIRTSWAIKIELN